MPTGKRRYEQRRIKASLGTIPGTGYEAWFKGKNVDGTEAYYNLPVICFVVSRMQSRMVEDDYSKTQWEDDDDLHTELRVFCYTDSAFGDDVTENAVSVLPTGATEEEVRSSCPQGRWISEKPPEEKLA